MDAATTDDNFFIEEPQKLRNSFFNKDKSLQIVELLAQKQHHHETSVTKQQKTSQFHPFSISFMMKKPELRPSSAEHITKLLWKVQHTLDYRDHKAIDWLSTALDEHLVGLVKTEDALETIDQLRAYVDSQCALLREIENTKCLLKPIADFLDKQHADRKNSPNEKSSSFKVKQLPQQQGLVRQRVYHSVDYIEL